MTKLNNTNSHLFYSHKNIANLNLCFKSCQRIIVSLNAVSINNIEVVEVGDFTIRLTKETVKTKGS